MLALLALAAQLAAQPVTPPRCDSAALFRDVRAHTGGARWDAVKELVAEGRVVSSGLAGRMRIADDLTSGARSVFDDRGIVVTRLVTSPALTWKQDLTHGVHRLDAPDARAAARTSAYLTRRGYFHPASDPASFACLSDVDETGTTLRRIRIAPRGGRPVTIWIDPAAHVVVRTQQQAPLDLETVNYGAYRTTNGLLLPHEIIETSGRGEDSTVRTIVAYRVLNHRAAADFGRPPDPTNQRIAGGSTRVPFTDEHGEAIVEAYVDGHGPLPFILDTGGHAILTADAAKQLGLVGRGGGVSGGGGEGTISTQYAPVRRLRIGGAEITGFPMFIIPYGKDFSDRGPGKPPLAGILGLEIFERFVVTIDYAHQTLRLQTPSTFARPKTSVAVPLFFQDDMPLTYAAADGARGVFGIDTGNGGRTVLIGDYVHHHPVFRRYTGTVTPQGSGTGGAVHGMSIRLRTLDFGGLALHNFVSGIVVQQKGAFSSRTEAGNIGHDVLSQFALTTDFRDGLLYLHRDPNAPLPTYTRSGVTRIKRDAHNRVVVSQVLSGSPAADAGLAAGDVILTIDGRPTETLDAVHVYAASRQAAGTSLRLTVEANGTTRDVNLKLRELLCNTGAVRCSEWVEPAVARGVR